MPQTPALVEVAYDEWSRGNDWGGSLRGPQITLEAIEELVRALDADKRTQVILAAGEEVPHLAIGGGAGCYIVEATWDNLEFHRASMAEPEPGEIELVTGGQLATFERAVCVGLEEALTAARAFALRLELAEELLWVKE